MGLGLDKLNGCSKICCKSKNKVSDEESVKLAMVQSELDSFYYKFKNLFCAEKDATLTLNQK